MNSEGSPATEGDEPGNEKKRQTQSDGSPIAPSENKPETSRKGSCNSDAESRRVRWVEVFAGVAALGSVSAAIVGSWQWNIMSGQLNAAIESNSISRNTLVTSQ